MKDSERILLRFFILIAFLSLRWIFQIMGWRRIVSLALAFVVGCIASNCIWNAALKVYPHPCYPTTSPLLTEGEQVIEQRKSADPIYAAQYDNAKAVHQAALDNWQSQRDRRESVFVAVTVLMLTAHLASMIVVYRNLRWRVLAD